MQDLLLDRPAPILLGALLGLVIVALLATTNLRLGALGGYSAVVERVTGRAPGLGWRGFFLIGIVLGSLVFRLGAGENTVGEGYGWLTRTFSSDVAVGALLVLGGALIGFGAKTAGGCTSGNGICGTSLGSPAAFVATATFMATAIGASFLLAGIT